MSGKLSQNRSGFISLMAFVTAVIMFIVGLGLLSLGFNRRIFSMRANQQIAARCAADYGLTKAVYAMNLLLPGSITPPLPTKTGVQISGSNSTYSYTVTGSNGNYSVQSTGTSGSITKTVLCDLRLKSAFEYAVLTKNNLNIGSCSKVECPGCGNIPLKIGTTNNPNSKAQITLKPNSEVDGDILLGQGGIPSLVIGPGATYGNIYAVATDYDLPMPTVPSYLSSAINQGSKTDLTTITTGQYTDLTVKKKNLTITGDVELYITGSITLSNSAKIIINPNSKLTIYLAGSLDGKNGAGFSNSGDPTQLAIYGLGSGSINLKNSDEFHGTIYAPNADVEIDNGVRVYGSVIANDYQQDNSAIFTYDANLRETTDVNLARFVPTHWQEL